MKQMTRPTIEIEYVEGTVTARVTITPVTEPSTVEYLRGWYGHQGDAEATEPIVLVLNGDDLSDLAHHAEKAREKADAAIWEQS